MIYIVSGYRRSGTSMMMQAIMKGLTRGMVLYRPDLEKLNAPEGDYQPNIGALLEVGRAWYMLPEFLRRIPDQSVIKIFFDGLPNLPAGDYRVIFMDRCETEIRASCERVDKHLRVQGVPENEDTSYCFDVFRPYKREDIEHVLGICRQRKDIDLRVVDFREVVKEPERVLASLDLPINVKRAASVVDPEHYRFRDD